MEEWKKIKEYDTFPYYVSNLGNVKREEDIVFFGKQKRRIGGNILSPKTKSNGYHELSLNINCKSKSFYVHRLVVEAWLGDIPKGFCVNHKDGCKSNNRLDNLEIVTYSENNKHAYKKGLKNPKGMKGENHFKAKFSNEDVLKMRGMYKNGVPSKDIANQFNGALSTVRKILYRSTWKHI